MKNTIIDWRNLRRQDNETETKSHITRTKILSYFADSKIDEIEVRDVIASQNELLAAFKDEGKLLLGE